MLESGKETSRTDRIVIDTDRRGNDKMSLRVIEADKRSHGRLLGNLLSLYLYDLSEFFDLSPDVEGRFTYDYDWEKPGNFAFLAFEDSYPVGFALVEKGSALGNGLDIWDMEEFFVLRPYRRKGTGIWLAHEIYGRFKGKWEIRIGEKNLAALAFWRRSLDGIECTKPEESFVKGNLSMFHCISTTIE